MSQGRWSLSIGDGESALAAASRAQPERALLRLLGEGVA
jgi:hypothetical protein